MARVIERHPTVRQVYVVGAVLAFVATFMPLFAVDAAESEWATLTLWRLIGQDGGANAAVGAAVVLALVAVALRASAARHDFVAPGGVLALSAIAVLMLLLKPGTGPSAPSLGSGGGLLLGTVLALAATALVDVLVTPRADVRRDQPIRLPD